MSLCTLSLAVQPFSASVVNGNLVLAASVTSNPPDALLFSLNALGQIVTRDNKCLSVSTSSVKAGACDTANSWVFEGPLVKPAGKPTICLDNFGRRYVVGNQVGVWTCNKGENQNWTLSCTAPSITGFSLPAHQNHIYNDNKYYHKVNYKHYQHFNGLAFSLDNFNNIKDDLHFNNVNDNSYINNIKDDLHFNCINDNGHYNNIKDDLHFNNVNNNSYINNINDNDHFNNIKDDLHFNYINDNGHYNYFKNNDNINDNNNINDNIYINDVKDINYFNYINDINYITDNIHNYQNHSHNNNQNNNNDNQHIHNQHNCDQHKCIICHACCNNSKC
ncbi:hypothetical protein HDU78_002918 [Chytriomyces hyalinus]|nr:hypothetical protein HDU78_002918 [Chytriomyces hyalinus]